MVDASPGVDLATVDRGLPGHQVQGCEERRGPAVPDGEGAGHPRPAGEDGDRPQQLVEQLGDHPPVHARRGTLVGIAEEGASSQLRRAILDPYRPDVDRGGHRVGVPDDGAGGEEVLGVPGVLGLASRGLARSGRPGQILGHPVDGGGRGREVTIGQRPSHGELGDPTDGGGQPVPGRIGRRPGRAVLGGGRCRKGWRLGWIPAPGGVVAHGRPSLIGAGSPGGASRRTPSGPPWRPRWRTPASRSRAPGPGRPPRTSPRSPVRTA